MDVTLHRIVAGLDGPLLVGLLPPLVARKRDEQEVVRAAAAASLGNVHDDKVVYPLIRSLADPSKTVRASALGASSAAEDSASSARDIPVTVRRSSDNVRAGPSHRFRVDAAGW